MKASKLWEMSTSESAFFNFLGSRQAGSYCGLSGGSLQRLEGAEYISDGYVSDALPCIAQPLWALPGQKAQFSKDSGEKDT